MSSIVKYKPRGKTDQDIISLLTFVISGPKTQQGKPDFKQLPLGYHGSRMLLHRVMRHYERQGLHSYEEVLEYYGQRAPEVKPGTPLEVFAARVRGDRPPKSKPVRPENAKRVIDQGGVERTLIFGDLHCPFEDHEAWDLLLTFAEWLQPTRVVANGDIADWMGVSRYSKHPERKDRLQEEIDATITRLREMASVTPEAERSYNEGNHEIRLKAYLWKHSELSSLRALAVPKLLELEWLGYEYYETHEDLWLPPGNLLVTHGTMIRKFSGYTAHAEMEKHGCHGVSGHSHRLAQFFQSVHGKTRVWCEGGHLSDVAQADYICNPDWVTGFTVIYHIEDQFLAQTVPIVEIRGKKRVFFEGKLWG